MATLTALMPVKVQELKWREQSLGEIDFPKERLRLAAGFGSGLATRPAAPGAEVWAISDRGPNLKIEDAVELYGWEAPKDWLDVKGAKLMPRPDVGPTIALLEITDTTVEVRRTVRITDSNGKPVSGLPVPESGHAECEPVLDLDGNHQRPVPSGMDTEGIALLDDGSFWVGEEYGPSLVKLSAAGEVELRLIPEGMELPNAGYPVRDSLPALAAKRHLNRGFEAIAVTPSNECLYLVFQSPLAHPSRNEHEKARHVRLWRLDADGNVVDQYAYRLDDPDSFRRDGEKKRVKPSDLKVCEIFALDETRLLVLERASETSKIYRVDIAPELAIAPEHLQLDTRPTLEELSCRGAALAELPKHLLFTSDDSPEVCADIEGMALIDDRSLLIVSDNDFGCEGKQTRFYRLTFDKPLIG